MVKNKNLILVFTILIFLVLSTEIVFAVGKLNVSWPKSPAGTDLNMACTPITNPDCNLPTMVKYFYEWGIVLGGLAAFIALVIAGFQYLTSVGDPNRMKDAKDRAVSAVGGLVLLLASWLILNTISSQFVSLEEPEFKITTSTFGTISFDLSTAAENCGFVVIYSDINYSGSQQKVVPIEYCSGKVSGPQFAIASLKIFSEKGKPCEEVGCSCLIELYEDTDCTGAWLSKNPLTTINYSVSDIGKLYLKAKNGAKSIKVLPNE